MGASNFTSIIGKVKKFFFKGSSFQTIVEQALKNILREVIPTAMDILTSVAVAKVGQVDNSKMSNDEKRQEVLNALQIAAINQGIRASASVLNLILETAVSARRK